MKQKRFTCLFALAIAVASFTMCQKQVEENTVTIVDDTTTTIPTVVTNWVHPGVLNTTQTLDVIRNQISANDTARTAAFQKVIAYIDSSVYPTSFHAIIPVVASGDSEAEKQIKDNANLAYAFALRFAATSEIVWANKAIGILNGWAYAFQGYSYSGSPADQPSLEASWAAPTFVAAAEIIRHYKPNSISANWQEADITQFRVFLNKLKDEINKMTARGNNWWVSAGYAKMAIGVFLESKTVYEDGRKKVMSTMEGLDSYNGHDVIDSDGYPYELHNRKDDVHFQYSLTGISYAAEIDKIQGANEIYTQKGERLSKAYDYTWRAFNEVIPAPAGVTGYDTCNLKSNVYPGVEIAYKQFGANSMRELRNLRQPIGNVSKLFLGFTSFTHYNLDGQSGAYYPADIPLGSTISLKGNNNKYVSSNYGKSRVLVCDRNTVGNWEKFVVEPANLWNRTIALKNIDKYVSSENGASVITCNRDTIGNWEGFSWINVTGGKVNLKGNNNKYVSSEDGNPSGMSCTKSAAASWETFSYSIIN